MPDPADLPAELFDRIIEVSLKVESQDDVDREYDFHDGTDLRQLSELVRVNRRWYGCLTSKLYSKWSYNGARHTHQALWQFLRTIMGNTQLADMVHTINIGNWGYYPDALVTLSMVVVGAEDEHEFSGDEVDLMRKTIRGGFHNNSELESRILDPASLLNGDCRPLVVLLLMCLPNLSTAYLHLPEDSASFAYFLQQVLRFQDDGMALPCLRHLAHLHLLAEVPVNGVGPAFRVSDPGLKIADIWPCIYFSGLRSLALYDLDTEGIVSLLAKHSERACHLEDMRLVIKPTLAGASSNVRALVTLPQSLTRFSIYWDHNLRQTNDLAPGISVAELWDALQKHRESLEHLEVFYNVNELDDPPPGYFGSLQAFTRLKRLDVQMNVLLDGMTPERLAPFTLKDTIPQTLDTLVLYPDWAGETRPDFQTTELQNMVERSRPLVLALGDNLAAPYYNQIKECERTDDLEPLEAAGPEPYPGLWSVCKGSGTQLHVSSSCVRAHIPGPCEFHKGGACQWLWRRTWKMRMEGLELNRYGAQRLPKGVPLDQLRPKSRRLKTHTLPFTDNTGSEAFMVFHNDIKTERSQLPPLFPIVVYFTHPDATLSPASPKTANVSGLLNAISVEFHFRFDVYFLPGASEDYCKAHYLAERATRPDYETVYNNLQTRARQASAGSGNTGGNATDGASQAQQGPNPPNLPPAMAYTHRGIEPYRGLFLICHEANWRAGAQRISCVRFDRMTDPWKVRRNVEPRIWWDEANDTQDEAYAQDTADTQDKAETEDEGNAELEAAINTFPESITQSFRIAWNSPMTDDDDKDTISDWLRRSTKDIDHNYNLMGIHMAGVRMGWTSWSEGVLRDRDFDSLVYDS